MNKVVSFKDGKQLVADKKIKINKLNKRQKEILDNLDTDEIGKWEDLIDEFQNNDKELRNLKKEESDDDDIELVFDKSLKARNSALDAIENARKNGINISDEEIAKIFN